MFGKKRIAFVFICLLIAALFAGCGMFVVSEDGVVSKLNAKGYDLHFFSQEELDGLNRFELESSDPSETDSAFSQGNTEKPVAAAGIPPKIVSAISAGRSDGEWIKIYWFKDEDKAKAYYDYHRTNGIEDLYLHRNVVYRGSEGAIDLLF